MSIEFSSKLNKLIWPSIFLLLSFVLPSIAFSNTASIFDLNTLKLSIAPALIRLSTALLFTAEVSILSIKSSKEVNFPLASLVFTIESITFIPTFLIAAIPKIIISPLTVNFPRLSFILGDITCIPFSSANLI